MATDRDIVDNLRAPIRSFRLFALEQAIVGGCSAELLATLEECRQEEQDEECLCLLPHAIAAVRSRLAARTGTPGAAPETREAIFANGGPQERLAALLSLPARELSRVLARLEISDHLRADSLLRLVLEDTDRVQDRVRAAAFRAAARLGIREFLDPARAALRKSDEGLVVAALDYLEAGFPDQALEAIPRFYNSPSARIRTCALRILSAHDPEQAVSLVMAMLKSSGSHAKTPAISCLMTFNFPSIRKYLVEALEFARDPDLLEGVLLLFGNNPDPENLYFLFRMGTTFSGREAARIEEVYRANVALINDLQLVSAEELRRASESFPQRLREEKSRRTAPSRSTAEGISQGRFPGTTGIAFAGLLGIAALWGLLWALAYSSEGSRNETRLAPVLAAPVEIAATVTAVDGQRREIEIRTTDGTVFHLAAPPPFDEAGVGDRIRAVVTPFRSTRGRVMARFINMTRE